MANGLVPFEMWERDKGTSYVNKHLDISAKKFFLPFIEWINSQRKENYYKGLGDTSKVAKYRKKTNTQRTKERSSYKRGSQFGGEIIEKVISKSPGEMSKITISEVLDSYYIPGAMDYQIVGIEGVDDSSFIDKSYSRLTRKILTEGLGRDPRRGVLPQGYRAKYDKVVSRVHNYIAGIMAKDGY